MDSEGNFFWELFSQNFFWGNHNQVLEGSQGIKLGNFTVKLLGGFMAKIFETPMRLPPWIQRGNFFWEIFSQIFFWANHNQNLEGSQGIKLGNFTTKLLGGSMVKIFFQNPLMRPPSMDSEGKFCSGKFSP